LVWGLLVVVAFEEEGERRVRVALYSDGSLGDLSARSLLAFCGRMQPRCQR